MWCYGNVCSTLFSFESILLKAQLSTGVLFQLFHLLSDVYHVTVRCIRVAFRKARELCVVHNCQRVPTLVTYVTKHLLRQIAMVWVRLFDL